MAKPFLIYNPKIQINNTSGLAASGAQIFIYMAGTVIKTNSYPTAADAVAETNPNPNPIICNSIGQPSNNGAPIDIYVNEAVDITAAPSTDTDPPTNAFWTEENITSNVQVIQFETETNDFTVTSVQADYFFEIDAGANAVTATLPPIANVPAGFRVMFKRIDDSSNDIIIEGSGIDTIDGESSVSLDSQYSFVAINSDGTTWYSENPVPPPVQLTTNVKVISVTGTYTPTTNMSFCMMETIGAGGGGGGSGAPAGGNSSNGGGGGAGAYSCAWFDAATVGASQAVTIGTAGAGGATSSNGSAGTTTSIGTLLTAPGGSGGTCGNPGAATAVGAGGAGGVAGTSSGELGDPILIAGNNGANGFSNDTIGLYLSGAGANGRYGAGGAGSSGGNVAGNVGSGNGSGGGGGVSSGGQVARAGGAGTAGYVIITEYITN